jgi:hypothetical protein
MANHVEFNRVLDRLYKRRTDRLRRILYPKTGKIRTLTKRHRERGLQKLKEIAFRGLAEKLAKKEFDRSVAERKSWRPRGWGREKKLKEFRKWTEMKISRKRGKVYVFWRKRECRYVGRTAAEVRGRVSISRKGGSRERLESTSTLHCSGEVRRGWNVWRYTTSGRPRTKLKPRRRVGRRVVRCAPCIV